MSPYILAPRRADFYDWEMITLRLHIANAGELNYLKNQLDLAYIKSHGLTYQSINDCVGSSICAANELYRRVAVPLEDRKCAENGDVYDIFDGEDK